MMSEIPEYWFNSLMAIRVRVGTETLALVLFG